MKWERIAGRCREHAHKLRQALAGSIELHRGGKWGRAEVETAGLMDYARTFGHPISARTFWRLFDRAIARDAGRGDFTRLDLYLPAVIAAQPKLPAFETAAAELPDLSAAVVGVVAPEEPSAGEMQLIWDAACNEWQRLSQTGSDAKAKKAVLTALAASGVDLARSYASLRRTL